MFAAVLDTCVLWPSLRRDFLLSLAIEGLYRPLWSSVILDELEYNEIQKLRCRGKSSDEAQGRAAFLVSQLRLAFADAEVHGWKGLEGTYGLPDRNDEHVVAAAVVGGAGAVVTENVRDFPADRLPSGLDALRSKDFAANTVALDPRRSLRAVEQIAARSGCRGPRLRVDDILGTLVDRYGMTPRHERSRRSDKPHLGRHVDYAAADERCQRHPAAR